MEGAGWTKAAVTLAVLTVATAVAAVTHHNYVAGPIVVAALAAAAARCWYLGG